jgi:hypothetical protein
MRSGSPSKCPAQRAGLQQPHDGVTSSRQVAPQFEHSYCLWAACHGCHRLQSETNSVTAPATADSPQRPAKLLGCIAGHLPGTGRPLCHEAPHTRRTWSTSCTPKVQLLYACTHRTSTYEEPQACPLVAHLHRLTQHHHLTQGSACAHTVHAVEQLDRSTEQSQE